MKKPLIKNRLLREKYKGETDEDIMLLPQKINKTRDPMFHAVNTGDKEDIQATELEFYMLRGVRNEYRLKALLNVGDVRTIRKLQRRVYNRWGIDAGRKDYNAIKVKTFAKLDMVQGEAWDIYTNTSNDKDKLSALRLVETIIKTEAEISGLKAASVININSATENNDNMKIINQLNQNKALQEMASEFTNIIQEGSNE